MIYDNMNIIKILKFAKPSSYLVIRILGKHIYIKKGRFSKRLFSFGFLSGVLVILSAYDIALMIGVLIG